MSNVKTFGYTKANGHSSVRTAYILHGASDLALCIDLSEFNDKEQTYYEAKIDSIRNTFFESLKEAGLGSNIRTFKEEKMNYIEELENTSNLARKVV